MGIPFVEWAVVAGGLLFMIYILNAVRKARAAFKGRDRCNSCGAKLGQSLVGLGYAARCRACGRVQPWAEPDR